MEERINLSVQTWDVFNQYLNSESPRKYYQSKLSKVINSVAYFVLLIFLMGVLSNLGELHIPTLMTVLLFWFLTFILSLTTRKRLYKTYEPAQEGPFCGIHNFEFNEEGVKTSCEGHYAFNSWNIFKRVVNSHGLIMIFLDNAKALIIPIDQLENPDELLEYISKRI